MPIVLKSTSGSTMHCFLLPSLGSIQPHAQPDLKGTWEVCSSCVPMQKWGVAGNGQHAVCPEERSPPIPWQGRLGECFSQAPREKQHSSGLLEMYLLFWPILHLPCGVCSPCDLMGLGQEDY